jgi:hypothetical protein
MIKQNRLKTYPIVVIILLLISLAFNIKSIINKKPVHTSDKQLKEKENQISFFEKLLEADAYFFEKSDVNKALNSLLELQNYKEDLNRSLQENITSKIVFLKQFGSTVNKSEDSDLNRHTNQLKVTFQNKLDSITNRNTKYIDSLNSLVSSLRERAIAAENKSSGSQKVKVISFKGVKGVKVHYIGEVENGKANGNGVGIWTTGGVYKGAWKNNLRHGEGTYEWADGEKFVGQYVADKRQGKGKYYWTNGERYDGDWKEDRRNGAGILFDMDGNIRFEGNWIDDKPQR